MKSDRIAAAAVLLAIVIGVLPLGGPSGGSFPRVRAGTSAGCEDDAPPGAQSDPPGPARAAKRRVVIKSNDQCYVCHMPFIEEGLAAVHAKVAVWCGTCHGPSTPHCEDENIGATPADIAFAKDKVDRMCGQCHDPEEHAILTAKTRSARLAEAETAQRKIKRRKIKVSGVCTDCHGRHWIPPRA